MLNLFFSKLLGRVPFSARIRIFRRLSETRLALLASAALVVLFHLPHPDEDLFPFLSVVSPCDTVVEVGSNTGGLTKLLAEKVTKCGQVIAVEPNPVAFAALRFYVRHYPNVILGNVALSSHPNMALHMTLRSFTDPGATLHMDKRSKTVMTIDCNSTTLDNFLSNLGICKVNAIFVDIEGHELDFIQGAKKIINNSRGLIIVAELHPRLKINVLEDVALELRNQGFRIISITQRAEFVTCVFQRIQTREN
jgi:FkbM family methyltransferase